jgi:hypothetical protein
MNHLHRLIQFVLEQTQALSNWLAGRDNSIEPNEPNRTVSPACPRPREKAGIRYTVPNWEHWCQLASLCRNQFDVHGQHPSPPPFLIA